MIKIFDYLPDLDAFLPTKEYLEIATPLGLVEWNPVVWIGRLFRLDNDNGEHWFDNWELREQIETKAKKLGYESDLLLIIDPERFQDKTDGPCHSHALRKAFWTDILKNLHLDLETLFQKAREENQKQLNWELDPNNYYAAPIKNLEEIIEKLRKKFNPALPKKAKETHE